MTIDGNTLSAAAGVALSLVISYVPGLSSWFEKRTPVGKRLTMGVLIVLAGIGSAVSSCGSTPLVECAASINLGVYVSAIIAALVANQGMYQLSSASSKS